MHRKVAREIVSVNKSVIRSQLMAAAAAAVRYMYLLSAVSPVDNRQQLRQQSAETPNRNMFDDDYFLAVTSTTNQSRTMSLTLISIG